MDVDWARTERGIREFDPLEVRDFRAKGISHGKFGHNIHQDAFYGRAVNRSFTGTTGHHHGCGYPWRDSAAAV